MSSLDSIKETLEAVGTDYTLEVLGKVRALGLNDDFEDKEFYELRKLSYKNKDKTYFIVEQMQRSHDCDFDDYLMGIRFENAIPEDFKLEIYTDVE